MQSAEFCMPMMDYVEQSRGTVLFVDDEARILESLDHALAFEPFRLLTAASASQALDVLARTRVDVVVTDERMPKMSGSQLLSVVCREYPRTIRIILTGQASVDAAVRAINTGEVYRFLIKPFCTDELVRTIKAALRLRDLTHKNTRPLHVARSEQAVRDDLELLHPQITRVVRDAEGALIVDAANEDVDQLLEELRKETHVLK